MNVTGSADVNDGVSEMTTTLKTVIKVRRLTAEHSLGNTMTAGCMLLLRLLMMRMMAVDVVTRVLLLPLGASVLKPDLDLCLGESERKSQTETLADGQVASEAELALERRQLIVAKRRSSSPAARPASSVVAAGVAAAVTAGIRRHLPVVVAPDTFATTAAVFCV